MFTATQSESSMSVCRLTLGSNFSTSTKIWVLCGTAQTSRLESKMERRLFSLLFVDQATKETSPLMGCALLRGGVEEVLIVSCACRLGHHEYKEYRIKNKNQSAQCLFLRMLLNCCN
ncbi:hypothetical protein CAPTEDRAFT_224443 [Capitella teleta]|uniref:Uncharacterized protein n=1 Tax=Capitella teleta TaxID=283909 RepID=R7TVR5_CAPTE|nr:hypothetical protein CAPTEDRAFT_224443 [Capitella teleta]|eukprot:ELT95100.1 hypothetical protein CAPTEDRAFT_224443 [Capitella teleta]